MDLKNLPLLLLVPAMLVTFGCTVNPATGERQLTLMSEAQEIAMGQSNDPQIVATMGLYPDEEWQAYIQELGESLAKKSERPHLPWTFRVIDDPVVNAFALPGGYIYVTRGILSHFNSEAELVSVLGHEIGHVTGRHGVERLSKAQLATVGIGVAAVANEDFRRYAGLAQQGLELLFLKFSRDDEREADDLGLRYLVSDGYNPYEMPKVFNTLDRVSAAHGARTPGWLATHPAPANRALRIGEQVAQLPPESLGDKVLRNSYLSRLNNLTFGTDPRQGYTVGSTFYQPDMAFALDFPEGWQIVNQRQFVGAISPDNDAVVVLTLADKPNREEALKTFFQQEGVTAGDRWQNNFYYFKAKQGASSSGQAPPELWGLMGVVEHQGNLFQLLSYTQDSRWSSRGEPMKGSLQSFRRVTDRRYLDVQPKKVKAVKLKRAMTLEEFHRRFPSTIDLEALAILNGVRSDEQLPAGRMVKRITGGDLPDS